MMLSYQSTFAPDDIYLAAGINSYRWEFWQKNLPVAYGWRTVVAY